MPRTIVYVDGFNLYYRALKGTKYRWLNLAALSQAVLRKGSEIVGINYYTARVSGRVNGTASRDQQIYIRALRSILNVVVHYGKFQVKDVWAFVSKPPRFRPACWAKLEPTPQFVCITKTEEKGSDVNLGAHLVRDAFTRKFEHAAVLTNDTDLTEPIRVVTEEAQLPVTLMSPVAKPAFELARSATYVRHISPYLGVSQFPSEFEISGHAPFERPEGW